MTILESDIRRLVQDQELELKEAISSGEERIRKKDMDIMKIQEHVADLDEVILEIDASASLNLSRVHGEASRQCESSARARLEEHELRRERIHKARVRNEGVLQDAKIETDRRVQEIKSWTEQNINVARAEIEADLQKARERAEKARAELERVKSSHQAPIGAARNEAHTQLAEISTKRTELSQALLSLNAGHQQSCIRLQAQLSEAQQDAETLRQRQKINVKRLSIASTALDMRIDSGTQTGPSLRDESVVGLAARVRSAENTLFQILEEAKSDLTSVAENMADLSHRVDLVANEAQRCREMRDALRSRLVTTRSDVSTAEASADSLRRKRRKREAVNARLGIEYERLMRLVENCGH